MWVFDRHVTTPSLCLPTPTLGTTDLFPTPIHIAHITCQYIAQPLMQTAQQKAFHQEMLSNHLKNPAWHLNDSNR